MANKSEYKPLQDVMIALNGLVKRSGMSLREVQRKLEKENVNLYNVCSVANGNPEQLSSVVRFDGFISDILKAIGKDEYDLIKEVTKNLTNPSSPSFQEDLSVELKMFLNSPESKKYLMYAYKRYQLDKLAEERERIKKELGEDL